jgi:hypothetical protein
MEGGLDLEKQTSIPVEAELFFLTSLFIELIEGDGSPVRASMSEIALITTVIRQNSSGLRRPLPIPQFRSLYDC